MKSPITTSGSATLPGLPPGTYTAQVDAAEGGGPIQNDIYSGSFPFLIQPVVTLSATPSSVSYTQQTVKFSGQAVDYQPGTMSQQPFRGRRLQIVGPATKSNPTGSYTVTTDSQGNFQLSVSPLPDNYYAFFQPNSSTAEAQSQIVVITASPTPIRLAAKFASDAIEYGRTDEMTGSLKYYQSSKTLKPLPDTTVTIARLTPPGQPKITVKTNADGGFRVHIPRQTATGMWAATAGGTTLLGKAEVTRPLAVHQTTGFKRTSITLSAYGFLTVKSCLVDTSPGRSGTQVNSPIAVQYRNSARARWKQLVTVEPTYGAPYCRGGSPLWKTTVRAPAQNAYYRLRFAGNQTLRVSVSKVRHLWREETRITKFAVSPRHAHVNGAVTVSGRLWRAATTKNSGDSASSGPWTPYADCKVAVIFIIGGKDYAFDSKPRTNSNGYFSGLFTVYGTAEWLARYNGDRTHFAASSRQIKVTASGKSNDALKLRELATLIQAGVLAQAQAAPK
ncbi:MAG TPA: hypothetical protein VHU92_17370 [Streptosporangiaceae bacterium]|nr:hypothetical protein [Streptosporangiaceae bacterium]